MTNKPPNHSNHTTDFGPVELMIDTNGHLMTLLAAASRRDPDDRPEFDMAALTAELTEAVNAVRRRHMDMRDSEFLAAMLLSDLAALLHGIATGSKGDAHVAMTSVAQYASAICADMVSMGRSIFHQVHPGAVGAAGTA